MSILLRDYITTLAASSRLSPVKQKILCALWPTDDLFPGPWIKSSYLLELTGQKYFDRRARELRDESGCDISTQPHEGEHCWRLNSANIAAGNTRLYLSEADKTTLFRRHEYTCAVCGVAMAPGVRGLQADHKVPLSRGGSHDLSNWQPLCNECNVGKRRACAECEDDCRVCSWAFPEVVGITTAVSIPTDLLRKLERQVDSSNGITSVNDVIIKLIQDL